jgi:hypothetical protein
MAAAIDTRAVAMTELLMGLSAAPMSIGVTNRGPNGRFLIAAASSPSSARWHTGTRTASFASFKTVSPS